MKSRLDLIIESRTAERLAKAKDLAAELIRALREMGLDASLIGSLANGEFRLHSDIDILVKGPVVGAIRGNVDRIVRRALAGSTIGCDIVYLEDLSEDQRAAFDDIVHAWTPLRRLWQTARIGDSCALSLRPRDP
jgi:hypothetical protein